MRRLWNKVLVYLARLGAPGAVRRVAVIGLITLAVVVGALGYWGWAVLERQQPGIEFDRWTRLYRTQTLFTGEDGSLLKVPWQLDAARLLAPIVLLGFGALAVFNLASVKMQRFGVRHAKGHVLFIGQPARLDRLRRLLGKELPSAVAVYAVPDVSKVESSCLRLEVDLDEDEWPSKASAKSSAAIVVAVQDDDRAVGIATLAAERFPNSQLVIDVGSAETMRWLGLWMMTRHPNQDIRVISIDQADSRVQAAMSGATGYKAVVVAGEETGARRIVTELHEQMTAWGGRENAEAQRPLLFIVDGDRPGLRSGANDAVQVEAGSESRAIEACGRQSARVLALGRSGMKTGLRIAAAMPGSEFIRLDADGFDGRQLVEQVLDGDIDEVLDGLLHGPLHLLTASALLVEYPDESERPAPHERSKAYANRVAGLYAARFRIHVEQQPPPYVPVTALKLIARSLELPNDDDYRIPRALVHGLAVAGYGIAPPDAAASADAQPSETASTAVDEMNQLVEDVARFNHAKYLEGPAEPGNPSHVAWDDLPPDLKQQNYGQARHEIELLEAMGISIEKLDRPLSGPRIEAFTEVDRHDFGRREHDRWARNKVASGFVWGPDRDPTGTARPQPHPDLVDYADLLEESQAKDYEPVLHAVEAFGSAGYALVKRA